MGRAILPLAGGQDHRLVRSLQPGVFRGWRSPELVYPLLSR
nr:hypothetical protein [Aeromonas dhakensis]